MFARIGRWGIQRLEDNIYGLPVRLMEQPHGNCVLSAHVVLYYVRYLYKLIKSLNTGKRTSNR